MSCDDFIISPRGRAGIGVNQPQSGLDYPLVAPSADIRYLIADFYLAYDDPHFYRAAIPERVHPLRIKWLYGVGCEAASAPGWAPTPVHAADIIVVDAEENVVFDSTQLIAARGDPEYSSFRQRSWGDDYEIYEWIGSEAVCRLVVYKTWPPSSSTAIDDEWARRNWPVHLAPENAVLDERAVYKLPRRLRSLRVGATPTGLAFRQTGVVLAEGHNMEITAAAPGRVGARRNTNITLAVIPGTGTGKYEDCPEDEPTSPILQINGVSPREGGDFLLSGADCIYIRQPTELVGDRARPLRVGGSAALAINTDCPACCDCPDYAAVALYMNRVAALYAGVGQQAHQAKLLHEGNIDRWVEQRDCRLQRPLRVLMTPQNCPTVDVVIMYCNQCQQCAEDVSLAVSFSAFPAPETVEVVCGYTTLTAPGYPGVNYKLQGTYPNFTAQLPPIDVGNSAYVKFRLRFLPKTAPYAVTATLTGTDAGDAVRAGCELTNPSASATTTVTLKCSATGETLQNC
jgi:hypothetical protein